MDGFILQLKDYFNNLIWEQLKIAMDVASPVLDAFRYVAFIFVLVKILRNLLNDPTNWMGYLSWLPLSLLLFQYDLIVEFFVDLANAADTSVSMSNHKELYKQLFDLPEALEPDDVSLFDVTISYIRETFNNALELVILNTIFQLVVLISGMAYIYLKFKAMFRFVSLIFFGPINISLSFMPGMENQWLSWMLKLLEVSMYIPFLIFIDFLGLQVLENAFRPEVAGAGEGIERQSRLWMGIAFFSLLGTAYFFIPKMVRYGMAQASAGVGGARKIGAATALAARKVMTGGI